MGWKTDLAYDNLEREEWRRFLATRTHGQRLVIRLKQALVVAILLAFGVGPIAYNIYLYHL